MKIKISDLKTKEELYNGDIEEYLEMNDYDTELEAVLNVLDYSNVKYVKFENMLIEKELELIYD